jgi:hypothetical protein
MTLAGFPHSGTPGSTPTCGSPRLFAACRALLRLSVPRHPPCALSRLTGFARSPTQGRGFRPTDPTHTLVLARLSSPRRRVSDFLSALYPDFQSNPVRECCPKNARPVSLFPLRRSRSPYPRLLEMLQKGGDPAAGSPTATLLRLRPSHRARLRPLPPLAGLAHGLRALPTPMA